MWAGAVVLCGYAVYHGSGVFACAGFEFVGWVARSEEVEGCGGDGRGEEEDGGIGVIGVIDFYLCVYNK
jgi:hypothetical protein